MDLGTMYDVASEWTAGVFGGVGPDQYGDPTPCSEWNVHELMNHIVGGGLMFATVAEGKEMPAGGPPPDLVGDDPEGAFRRSAAAVRAAIELPDVTDRMMSLPAGELPGHVMFTIAVSETLVHGWDLATATGQDTSFDEDVAGAIYEFTAPGVESGREAGFYGPPVDVPADASIRDRLLGMLSRQPQGFGGRAVAGGAE